MNKQAYKAHMRAYRLARNTAIAAMYADQDNAHIYSRQLMLINQEFEAERYIPKGFDKYHPNNAGVWLINAAINKKHLSQERAKQLADMVMQNVDLPYPIEPAAHLKNYSFYKLLLNNLDF